MARNIARLLSFLALAIAAGLGFARAESVDQLTPSDFINDYAHVLSPQTAQQLNLLCGQMQQRADAQIFVAIVNSLPEDDDIDDFANRLFQKWGVGKKGSDHGVLFVISLNPRRYRIEVGYGLEPILNDARVGDIGRAMVPYLRQNDYNQALTVGLGSVARVIADDAHVQLDPQWQYRGVTAQPRKPSSPWQPLITFAVIIFVLFVLTRLGGSGLLGFLLGTFFGGGWGGPRGGGGWGGGGGGGWGGGGDGFSGGGGGSSGGGGASGSF